MPSEIKVTVDECQQIFKLRSKVAPAKLNQRNRYENYECEACKLEDETQDHIMVCKTIIQMQNDENKCELPEYEKVMNGNVREQMMIAKIFNKKMKIIENLRKKN